MERQTITFVVVVSSVCLRPFCYTSDLRCGVYPCNSHCALNDLACRRRLSWGFQCHSRELCQHDNCSNHDLARRAGNICDEWPYYNGGYPLNEISWDEHTNPYSCHNLTSDGYCGVWSAASETDVEIHRETCRCLNGTARYCQRWECDKTREAKCEENEIDEGNQCCSTCSQATRRDSIRTYHCCEKKRVDRRRAECACETATANSCASWSCLRRRESHPERVEVENFTCVVFDTHERCRQWEGRSDSVEEFEFFHCNCTNQSKGFHCKTWECHERSMKYFYPNLFLALLPVLFGSPCFISAATQSTGNTSKEISDCCGFFACSLVWCFGLLIIVVWLGGVGALVVAVGIILFLLLFSCLWIHGLAIGLARRRGGVDGGPQTQVELARVIPTSIT